MVLHQFPYAFLRRGIDPDAIDDFLDQIVVAWRKDVEKIRELESQIELLKTEKKEPTS